MFKGNMVTGTVEGTGAAITVQLGFVPTYVRVVNIDDPTTLEWMRGMPAASAIKLTDAPALTKITSNGITVSEGTPSVAAGFVIGADADANVDGETIHYLAMTTD